MVFPNIKSSNLTPFLAIKKNPHLLDDPDCPYPPDVLEFLRNMIQPKAVPDMDVPLYTKEEDDIEVLEREVSILAKNFKDYGATLQDGDVTEKLQYFKTHAGLVEKLISMKERVINLKQMSEFQNIVIELLTHDIDDELRNTIIDRLGDHL